jgi:hypothetical protein
LKRLDSGFLPSGEDGNFQAAYGIFIFCEELLDGCQERNETEWMILSKTFLSAFEIVTILLGPLLTFELKLFII